LSSINQILQSAWRTSVVTGEKLVAGLLAGRNKTGEVPIPHLNKTVGDYVWQYGLSYDDEFAELLALMYPNGTQTDSSKVGMAEAQTIWLNRISMKVANVLFTVRAPHIGRSFELSDMTQRTIFHMVRMPTLL